MRLSFPSSSLLLLLQCSSNHAFVPVPSSTPITASPCQKRQTQQSFAIAALYSTRDDGDDEGGDGGWFDDYDEFVDKLDFEGGGWDRGADAPFDGPGGGGYGYAGGSGRRGGGGRGRGGYDRGGRSGRRGGYRPDLGTKGHDYQRDPNDTKPGVDEAAVDELLASRLHYRLKRMFDAADDIRDELRAVHGVTVWDKDRTWTASAGGGRRRGRDGDGGGRGRGGRGRGGGGRGGGRFDRGGGGSGRGRGRERRFNEHGHDYSQTGGPVDPAVCSLTESEIHALIKERMECKFARNFRDADAIEAELSDGGVDVHDGFKEWRADGERWGRSDRSDRRDSPERARTPKVYSQRGPGKGLTSEAREAIAALVVERSAAKADVDYARADAIFETLQTKFNVNVDDRSSEWALLSEEYQLNRDESAFVPDDAIMNDIGTKLGERILARKRRDFNTADDIRDVLRDEYMVEINDRLKEWVVVDPPDGIQWEEDGDGEGGGMANVASKGEWDEDDGGEDGDDEDAHEDDVNAFLEEVGISSSSSTLDESVLAKLKVPELKEKLREAGLPVSGKKNDLIERLLENAAAS